jgi:hypothetical protein
VSNEFKKLIKHTVDDLHVELINRRKNELNSKILAALDSIFTKDSSNLDNLTNMFNNAKFCSNNETVNLNNNNNNSISSQNCYSLLKAKNLQTMLPNPIMIGNTRTKNLLKNILEVNQFASLNEFSSATSSSVRDSFCNDQTTSQNLRDCKPIECISSDCARNIMKLNLPEFIKSTSNQTPSLTIAELDSKKLKFLMRLNKTNEYGGEQFISYKFDLQRDKE